MPDKEKYLTEAPDALAPIDSQEPIQSQYAASPRMQALFQAMAKRIDPKADIDLFYQKIFDPETAEGVGLDVWGRIVAATRQIMIDNTDFLGFALSGLDPMNISPFFNEAGADGEYRLADNAYRELIFYKAMANISGETMQEINALLNALFTRIHGDIQGRCFVLETGVMEIRAVFFFYLSPFETAMLRKYSLLNRGAGVGFNYFQVDPDTVFGFAGTELQPFNQGVFNDYPIVTVA